MVGEITPRDTGASPPCEVEFESLCRLLQRARFPSYTQSSPRGELDRTFHSREPAGLRKKQQKTFLDVYFHLETQLKAVKNVPL